MKSSAKDSGSNCVVDVGQLAVLDERLGVGQRDLEDVRQRATGELRGEGRREPVVLLGSTLMSGLAGLELVDARVQRVDGLRLGAGLQARHREGDLAVGLAAPSGSSSVLHAASRPSESTPAMASAVVREDLIVTPS